MDLEKIEIGTVLISKGNGERIKIKGFKIVETSPNDIQLYITVKPYSEDALGKRKKYDITSSMAQTYYEIEES